MTRLERDKAMCITTPRGLRIRLAIDYSFVLIARLYPSVSTESFFRTVEGLDSAPALAAFTTGIVVLASDRRPTTVIATVILAELAAFVAVLAVLPRSKTVAQAGSAYRQAAWYGIPTGAALLVGLLFSGWPATLAYFAGRAGGRAATLLLDRAIARVVSPWPRVPLLSAERHFLNAYRLHAARLKRPTDLLPADEEFEGPRWSAPFDEFVARHPEVVDKWV